MITKGIFGFSDVPLIGRTQEKVEVFGSDKVVYIFLPDFVDSLIFSVPV